MSTRLAVIGAGPIGVEAAARAAREGFDVTVYEAGSAVGEHVRAWSHVQLFSPWEFNRSRWGVRRLPEVGVELADDETYPTGAEYLAQYLEPLADLIADDVRFCLNTEVLGVSRRGLLKPEHIGDPQREAAPFVLRVDGPDGVRMEEAQMVIDATGVQSVPNALGPGGLAAVGERKFDGEIIRCIPDVRKKASAFAGRHTLVVGDGHSALTTLDQLHRLQQEAPTTEVVWAFRGGVEPCTEIEDDPLVERARLDRFGNSASRGEVDGIEPIPHVAIRRLEQDDQQMLVHLQRDGQPHRLCVDNIVANVGYRPDLSLFRHLQVHLCYATDGPMSLAASLMGGDAGADCLDQSSGGLQTLETPEPNFFVLGAKSYGRNSNFLLRVGFEQIEGVFGSE